MKTKIEIKSILGNVIFTYEAENATIKDAIQNAILQKTKLSGADLRGDDLSGAKNIETAYIPLFCKWNYSILGDKIQIGCKKRTIEEWDSFFASDEVLSTKRGTEKFKQIEAIYLACKAYLTHLTL